jgi:hypothetical protein
VGPHQPYGFATGEIFDEAVDLWLPEGLIAVANQRIDFMAAKTRQGDDVYVVLLNNSTKEQQSSVLLGERHGMSSHSQAILLDEKGKELHRLPLDEMGLTVRMPPLALQVIKLTN